MPKGTKQKQSEMPTKTKMKINLSFEAYELLKPKLYLLTLECEQLLHRIIELDLDVEEAHHAKP